MFMVTAEKIFIGQHVAEGGRKGNAYPKGDMIPVKAVKNFQQRKIGFGKGVKKPAFLFGLGQVGAPD
jgi:hypothetical protein